MATTYCTLGIRFAKSKFLAKTDTLHTTVPFRAGASAFSAAFATSFSLCGIHVMPFNAPGLRPYISPRLLRGGLHRVALLRGTLAVHVANENKRAGLALACVFINRHRPN